ncbi:carbohydrate porin [Gluconacetobacter aggeris]|uniref:Carbohydrate porin n=1 Tax=Gluconacetobacter aggeris TaxID=1286186 RepID=A0A7W4IQ88_9PROT|nr:carbohydrate porin [Gluconacetobacter aggeris]
MTTFTTRTNGETLFPHSFRRLTVGGVCLAALVGLAGEAGALSAAHAATQGAAPTIRTGIDSGTDPSRPGVLIQPKGTVSAKTPGPAASNARAANGYDRSNHHHAIELDALTDQEGLSWLLPSEVDAQRRTDMADPYYVPTGAAGHLLPQIMPFRERLQKKGFTFSLTYKAEAMGDIDGGIRRGMDYVHEFTLQMLFDLGKMSHALDGWTVHTLVMNRAGREVSHDLVGDYYVNLMEVYGLSGHVVAHLVDFYAQKKAFHNRLDVAFGRMALTHVFATSPLLCSFMVTCSAPVALKVDPAFAVYPKATWGARARFRPTRDTAIQVGAYEVQPLADGPSGWAWASENATGLMLPAEFTWEPFLTHNKLPGHYVIGYAHDTTRYPDALGTKPAALVAQARRERSAPMDMFWLETEQMIYRLGGPGQMSGGYLMAGYVHNTPHVASISDEAYGGLSFNGVIPGRAKDRLGILYSWYHVSDRKRQGQVIAQDAGLSLGSQVRGPQTNSQVIEAYYGIDTCPGLVIQPEFQYMIHPGETSHIPNAALVGLKVAASL